MNLINLLSNIDNGAQAEIIGNRDSLELVLELAHQRNLDINLGQIISELSGGSSTILRSKSKRNILFMALNKSQRDEISMCIGSSNIFDFKYTPIIKESLHKLFSIDMVNGENLETNHNNSKIIAVSPKYGLFEHQSNALIECIKFLDGDIPRVMLHMPTGSGKTRTSMHLMARYLNQNKEALIIWLVSGKELCEQAANEFELSWSYLGERVMPVIKLWSDKFGVQEEYTNIISVRSNSPTKEEFNQNSWPLGLKDGVIIASLDSIRSLINQWEPEERHIRRSAVSLIIFDEAHRSVAPTYKSVIETLLSPSFPETKMIGLSATPGKRHYGDDMDVDKSLVELFKNQLVQLKIDGYNSPIDYLVEKGYLAKLEKEQLEIAKSNISKSELRKINESISLSMDIPDDILMILGFNATRNMQIVERVECLVKEEGHKRVLVFSPSVQSAIVLSNICKCIGINSSFVHASSEARDDVIRKYKSDNKDPMVIFNFGVLTTGFDAPRTSAVVIARPTTSLVLLNQMAGRAIRGPKVGGNKVAKLITIVDTEIPILVEPNKQFHAFDNSWSTNNV